MPARFIPERIKYRMGFSVARFASGVSGVPPGVLFQSVRPGMSSVFEIMEPNIRDNAKKTGFAA